MNRAEMPLRVRLAILLITLFGFSFGIWAQQDGDDVVIGKYRILHSTIMNEDRLLLVHLPRGYNTDRIRYPVLFHLYGDNIVDYIAPAMIACGKLGQTGEGPQMIIVGVVNTNRYRDNLPFNADGSPGGAQKFARFFQEELIPFIDRNYRTKPFRVLAGPQAGSKFALYVLLASPDLFDLYITTNPFEGNERMTQPLLGMAEELFPKTASLKKFFYYTCEENEPPSQIELAKRFSALVERHRPKGLRCTMSIIKPTGFLISPVPVLEALRAFFAEYRLPRDFQSNNLDDVKAYYERLSQEYGFPVEPPELMLTFEGDKLIQKGRTDEAIELFEYHSSLYPSSGNACLRLGEIYRSRGDYKKALEYYRQFLAIFPRDADFVVRRVQGIERYMKESAMYLVEMEIERSGIEAGVRLFEKLRADPQNRLTFEERDCNTLGYQLLGRGRTEDAIRIFQLTVKVYPNSANAYDSLGEAYVRAGNRELAIKAYEKALAIDPAFHSAIEALKRLKDPQGEKK